MSRSAILGLLAAFATAAAHAAPVFTDTFTNGSTLFQASVPGGTPTASTTSYQLASGGRNASVSSFVNTVSGSALRLTWSGSGSSNLAEGAAIFTTTPVALAAPGDSINVRYVFTNSGNIMSGPMQGANSALSIGLFNSNGSLPLTGTALANNGMTGPTVPSPRAVFRAGPATRRRRRSTAATATSTFGLPKPAPPPTIRAWHDSGRRPTMRTPPPWRSVRTR
jgi:hypothetical protein